eukprot:gnl/TRDRNA2_/TRDRNA2_172263_c0_seq5.p3 gnl/TRDRNA2_/TRDRNA2_172263_c0~~gnl/TRDRNA2_/TRDRNA2_172263_c0_seq5.p3  ORF type:complete len:102 (+),score=19.08 gnl/TRDRNA2_/TRDRNA2_172263_c0_seq5:446-751(+)
MGYHIFAMAAHVDDYWYPDFYEENWGERAECEDLQQRLEATRGVFRGGTADSSNYQYGQGRLGTIQVISLSPAVLACYTQYVATRDEALIDVLRTGSIAAV